MSVVAVGDFDGVHLGHKELLKKTVSLAKAKGTESIVLTFSRNSKSILHNTAEQRLTTDEEREALLRTCGVDRVVTICFDETFAALSASDFFIWMRTNLHCTDLIGGTDFRFGKGAVGTLKDGAFIDGIVQHVVDLKMDTQKISSSAIRSDLQIGDVSSAAKRLGRFYSVEGIVRHGYQLGRTMGFPTANITVPTAKILPCNGVYITETLYDGQRFRSVTNIGVRPTVSQNQNRSVETYLIGMAKNLYGKTIRIFFLMYLRSEKKFSDIDALKEQLSTDVLSAKRFVVPTGIDLL